MEQDVTSSVMFFKTLQCDEHAMSDIAPIIVWRIFNERLKAYIRSGMGLCVDKFQKRIASRKCLQRCMELLDRVSGTKPEVMVGCLLCLQVLKRYKRELGMLSSNMKINMDLNDLQAFITAN